MPRASGFSALPTGLIRPEYTCTDETGFRFRVDRKLGAPEVAAQTFSSEAPG